MSEVIFLVEEAPEGGWTARALTESIFTEAETIENLKKNIIDSVKCHFSGSEKAPSIIRLHYVKEETLANA